MPLFDFIRGTLESAFFNLPLDGPFNFLYLFLNFGLIVFATISGIFGIFGS
jgi:hypothetical protein